MAVKTVVNNRKIIYERNDLVSVIVPAYNVEKYLPKCVESILNQTYTNLEIIIVNDGSEDSTLSISQEYAKRDNRVRVIDKNNQGVSIARNRGIKEAKGDFVSFVDADDWIHPYMIEKLHWLITEHGAALSACGINRTSKDCEVDFQDLGNIRIYNREEYLKKFFKIGSNEILYHCYNKLYRRNLLDETFFPEYEIGEDVISTFKAIRNSDIIATTEKPLYYYRQGSGVTTTFNDKYFQLHSVWEEVVELAQSVGEECTDWAIINRDRIDFTILTELALAGESSNEAYAQKKAELLSRLKKNRKKLLSSDISLVRKIGIQLYCLDYDGIAKIVKKVIKRQQ